MTMAHRVCGSCGCVLTKKSSVGRWPLFCEPCRLERDNAHSASRSKRRRVARPPTAEPMSCKVCGETKPADAFRLAAHLTAGRRLECRPCENAAKSAHRKANPRNRQGELRRWRFDPRAAVARRLQKQFERKRNGVQIGHLLRTALRKEHGTRLDHWLGYTVPELRAHLESLFTDGMDWNAFLSGRIHIDHVKPLASFDLTDERQLWQAWQLSNLQPLWAKDNLSKGSAYAGVRHRGASIPWARPVLRPPAASFVHSAET